MTERVIIAGAGGQGIMLLGKVLAGAAMRQNKFVTWLPAYGAEVRGGSAYCMVTISDNEIGSPSIEKADTLIIMNMPSLKKFLSRLKKGGTLIINGSLADVNVDKKKKEYKYPFTDIALRLGNIKIANMVALGSYVNKKSSVELENVLKAISDIAPKDKLDLVEINIRALKEGACLK